MPTNIPTDLLRTLVAIADTGSISRATEQIFRSQSALSLQMRRLEELTKVALFRHEGRNLALTASGETLVEHAREMLRINDRAIAALSTGLAAGPIQIGLVPDFAEMLLPTLLTKFAVSYPDIHVQVQVSNSRDLNDMLKCDRLKLVLGFASPDSRSVVATDDLVWIGNEALLHVPILPLAVMDSPCICRDAALAALEAAGIKYRIVVETSNLAVLSNAVRSGLAITCRPAIYAQPDMQLLHPDGLPLPRIGYALTTSTPASPHTEKLAALIKSTLRTHQILPPANFAPLSSLNRIPAQAGSMMK